MVSTNETQHKDDLPLEENKKIVINNALDGDVKIATDEAALQCKKELAYFLANENLISL